MNSKNIHNDYTCLDQFSSKLKGYSEELSKNGESMFQRLKELNEKGFQDANFESLHNAFLRDIDYVHKLKEVFEKKSAYIDQLSKIIKEYYSVEL